MRNTSERFLFSIFVIMGSISSGAESLVFQFPIKNVKLKIYTTIILPVFYMGVKLGRLH